LVILLCLCSIPVESKPAKVALDTDIGTDCDDLWALVYILSRPDIFDLRLVQVSTFTTSHRAQIVAKILDTLHRTDVPIAIGDPTTTQGMPEYPWAQYYLLSTFEAHGGKITNGTDALKSLMQQSTPTDPLYIIEIAPVNSVANVLTANPTLSQNTNLVAMSGSIFRGYLNSPTPSAEYNVHVNISGSQLTYKSQWLTPLVTAPLDTTNFDQWNGAVYQPLVANNNTQHPYVQLLLENYQVWYDNGGKSYGALLPFNPQTGTSCMYDAQAAWMAGRMIQGLDFGPLKMQQLNVGINDGGFCVQGAQYREINTAVGLATTNPYDSTNVIGSDIIKSIINPST